MEEKPKYGIERQENETNKKKKEKKKEKKRGGEQIHTPAHRHIKMFTTSG